MTKPAAFFINTKPIVTLAPKKKPHIIRIIKATQNILPNRGHNSPK